VSNLEQEAHDERERRLAFEVAARIREDAVCDDGLEGFKDGLSI
jgi:hypothetical protein